LTLNHYQSVETTLLEARTKPGGAPSPPEASFPLKGTLLLIEIPSDFLVLKSVDMTLAGDWRFYTREVFETAFASGYLITDFIHDNKRSFYILTCESSTLQDDEKHADLQG
jgi:predicted GNAT superfamily acetyltransferase